jgi:H+-transporting ATPase
MAPSRELVPGDIIRLRVGDFVPADIKLVAGGIELDESAMTGESVRVLKGIELDESHLTGKSSKTIRGLATDVFGGSEVTRGEAYGIVEKTGADTLYGRTVELVQLAKPKLHMEQVISDVMKWILTFVSILLISGITITALKGDNVVLLLPVAAVLFVTAIPVALPSMFAISIAYASQILAKKGVLITRMTAGEEAAAMDVLCADKTGTMTINKLSISDILPYDSYSMTDVLLFGFLASNEANNDPIDDAFLEQQLHGTTEEYKQLEFMPFSPLSRMTGATVMQNGQVLTAWKGAPHAIASLCKLGEEDSKTLIRDVERMSSEGKRTIAVALEKPKGESKLIGLVALVDQLRPDSRSLVDKLKDLGISVKMLTGDSISIAKDTASNLGIGQYIFSIPHEEDSRLLDSQLIEKANGFAEIYPEDKYRIVQTLQTNGHIVGMTGDGVNDAPALKQADVGIAVTESTDVAKAASSVFLSRGGLSGILELVKAGRSIHQRIITWILNKIIKTFQVVVFVIFAFIITGQFVVSLLSIILFLFLIDFVTLSLSTDNVRLSLTPEKWKINGIVRVGIILGTLVVAESFVLFFTGLSYLGLRNNPAQTQTFFFDFLLTLGALNVLSLRERAHFWESRPSRTLLFFILLDVILGAVLSLIGLPELPSIRITDVLMILGFSGGIVFLLNDYVKIWSINKFVNRPGA